MKNVQIPRPISENIAEFTGRVWLLPLLLTWLEQTSDQMFILQGEPGAGKSMIMAWVAGEGPVPDADDARSQLDQIRSRVKAVHFCSAASGSIAPKAFAKNIAQQLTQNLEGFSEALTATLAEQVQISGKVTADKIDAGGTATGVYLERLDLGALSDELSFDRAFREPLQKLFEDGCHEPIILLVDALDEAATYSGSSTIVRLLSRLTDLSDCVRILITTRSDPRVMKYYRHVQVFDLISDAPADAVDVYLYTFKRLVGLEQERRRSQVAGRIARAAEGNFLYARLVLDDLQIHLPETSGPSDLMLPKGLSGLYHEFLNRELGTNEDRWYNDFKPVLGLVSVAQDEGLNRKQIEGITGKDVEQSLRVCKQYLDGDLPDGPFRVFHRSFADFLLDDRENSDYHVDAKSAHRQITGYYVSNFSDRWPLCDGYGLRNVAVHAAAAGLLDRIVTDLSWIVVTDPGRLLSVLHAVASEEGREVAMVYRLVYHRLTSGKYGERAAYLQLAARQQGMNVLADRIAQLPFERPWSVSWARWQRVDPHQILEGYRSAINAMAIGQLNGRPVVVSGDDQNELWVRDLASGELLYAPLLTNHLLGIRAVAIGDLSGRPVIASGDAEGRVGAWDLASGALLWSTNDYLWTVNALTIGRVSGRSVIVAGGGSAGLVVLDLANGRRASQSGEPGGERIYKSPGYSSKVYALATTSLDGRDVIVSGEDDGTIRIWDMNRLTELDAIRGHQGIVRALVFAELDGQSVLASGGQDGAVRLWNLGERQQSEISLVRTVGVRGDSVIALAAGSLRGRLIIISAGKDRIIQLWDMVSWESLGCSLVGHNNWVSAVAVTELNGELAVVSSSGDRTVRVWALTEKLLSAPADAVVDEGICAVEIDDAGGRPVIVSGGTKGTIHTWDLATGAALGEALGVHGGRINRLVLGSLGGQSLVVSGDESGVIKVWNLASRTLLYELDTGHETTPQGTLYAFALGEIHGRQVIVSGGADGTLRIWDLADGKQLLQPITAHTHLAANEAFPEVLPTTITALATGTLQGRPVIISCGYEDGTLKIWDSETLALINAAKMPIAYLEGESIFGMALGIVDKEPVAITAGVHATLRFWNLLSCTLQREVRSHSDGHLRIEDLDWFTALKLGDLGGQPVIFVGSRGGTVRAYNFSDGSLRIAIDTGSFIFSGGLAVAPGNQVVVAGARGFAVLQVL